MTIFESTVEQTALAYLESLGYTILHGPTISQPDAERPDYHKVILEDQLRNAIERLNPTLSAISIDDAFRKIIVSNTVGLFEDNRQFHNLLVNGVEIEVMQPDGSIRGDVVRILDFECVTNNQFLAVNQFSVLDNKVNRRPDIVLFINGLPLAVIELKNAISEKATTLSAYRQLQTYKQDIPTLFRSNVVLVVSDGIEARVGSLTANFERFMPWRTTDGKTISPKGSLELEIVIKGLFEQRILLDFIRNFVVFEIDSNSGQIVKKIAGYHQFHAVNKAIECTVKASSPTGDNRAGVIWHTQGSGKSLSMAFYAGKLIQNPSLENPTLVILTDRNDLDDQLFGTFSNCKELFRQTPVQAKNREDVKELLKVVSGGIVFTTIQKFAPIAGDQYPLLSDRRNIVVIADEAHRSQYDFIDGFARHMRDGLPNATFIGFTGTPISLSDKDTYAVFGNNIHTYDIHQAVEDGATVRIFYESRLAKITLNEEIKPLLDTEFEEVTEGEESDQKEKLKSKWARLESLVGAEKRVQVIAEDLVNHIEARFGAIEGKVMIVCMSRRICVELYEEIRKLRPQWHDNDENKGDIKIVMTGSASDPISFQPHIRNKAGRDALAKRFKDTKDSLKIAIVRDMWLTGFDVPCLHTLYIDKPMRGHGLMQAIARVNRVYKDKPGGLIVDYLGIAEPLKKALADYSQRDQSETGIPIDEAISVMLEKWELIRVLFKGFDYLSALKGSPEQKLKAIPEAMEHLLSLPDGRSKYLQLVLELSKSFSLAAATLEAKEIRDEVGFFQAIRATLLKTTSGSGKDSDTLDSSIQQLVSKAISSTEVIDIFSSSGLKSPDISILSDEFLAEVRGLPQRHLALETLKKLLQDEIKTRSRKNVVEAKRFSEMLQNTIARYQNRLIEAAQVIEELINLAKDIKEAKERGEKTGLSEDEIAFYDVLAENKSAVEVLGDAQLRLIAKELVESVRSNTSIDWTLKESVKAKIRVIVKRILRKYGYPPDLQEKATQTVLEQAELCSDSWISKKN